MWKHDHLRLGQSVVVDTQEMFSYLDLLIANPERRQEMGRQAREHVLAHLDWRCVMQQAYGLWQEMAAVAQTLPHEKALGASCIPPNYYADFGHYASQRLTGSETLQMTEWGRQACRRPDDIRLFPGMQDTLNAAVLLTILRYLPAASLFRQQISGESLTIMIVQKYKMPSDTAKQHLLWLLKYGLLQLSGTDKA